MKNKTVISVSPDGRIVIPKRSRKKLGVEKGGRIILYEDGDNFKIGSIMSAFRALQSEMTASKPKGRNMVDELIAERRAEAKRELAESKKYD